MREEKKKAKSLAPGKTDPAWWDEQEVVVEKRRKERKVGTPFKYFEDDLTKCRILPPPEGQRGPAVTIKKHFLISKAGKALVGEHKVIKCLNQPTSKREEECDVCATIDSEIAPSDRDHFLNRCRATNQHMFNAVIRASEDANQKHDELVILQTNDTFYDWFCTNAKAAFKDGIDITSLNKGRDIRVKKEVDNRGTKWVPTLGLKATPVSGNGVEKVLLTDLLEFAKVSDEDRARAKRAASGLRRLLSSREAAESDDDEEEDDVTTGDDEGDETPRKSKKSFDDEEEESDDESEDSESGDEGETEDEVEDDDETPRKSKKSKKSDDDDDEEESEDEDEDSAPPKKKSKKIKTAVDALTDGDDEDEDKPRGWRIGSDGKVRAPKTDPSTNQPVCFKDWVKRGNDPSEDDSTNKQCAICPVEVTCRLMSQKKKSKKSDD